MSPWHDETQLVWMEHAAAGGLGGLADSGLCAGVAASAAQSAARCDHAGHIIRCISARMVVVT